jgi:hypothetical protein
VTLAAAALAAMLAASAGAAQDVARSGAQAPQDAPAAGAPAPEAPAAATPAPAPGTLDAVAAAVEGARTDARREWTSPAAAAAAWTRLVRLREPLLASDDPRAAVWLCDAAEDDVTIGLGIDGCGVATAAGLPTPAQRDRATALLREALACAREAERRARDALAAGTATPEMANRLDATELARRIPLVRGCAAVLAAWAGALPGSDADAIVESAAMRLATMRATLTGNARTLADTCAGLGFARLGRRTEGEPLLAPVAADPKADAGLRTLAIAGLAECAAPSAAGRRRALDGLRSRLGPGLDDAARLTLGDLDFRLARAAANDAAGAAPGAAPPWRGWIDAVSASAPARRGAVRAEALARIARNSDGMDDPVARVARALAQSAAADSRAAGTSALRAAVADPALDPGVRALAMLELGRAELLLGNPEAGALALLAFAEGNPAEPSSRHAIDAAVAAARGTGDAALLARVLATAVARFPDHPDHGAWRVEQSAVALAPDAPAAVRDAPSRRAAMALDGLDRADRNGVADPAMRADLAIAAADALNEELRGDAAIEALARIAPAGRDAPLPDALRLRVLEERIRALVIATRAVDGDGAVKAALARDPGEAADAAARVLRRMAAADLGTVAASGKDAERASRVGRLADATLRMAPPTPERDEVLARAFVTAGMPSEALDCARRAVAARGDRADLLVALAEALWGNGGEPALAEAFVLYDRVARSVPEGSATWWLCQVRRLQVLDRVGRSGDAIAPRVARLRALDEALGGPTFSATLLELAARHE